MRLPSTPVLVTMNSPCCLKSSKDSTTDLIGWPWNFSLKCFDHSTMKPQLDGRNGSTFTPACSSHEVHSPREPSLGQLAPPNARMVASGLILISPSGWSNTSESFCQPFQL